MNAATQEQIELSAVLNLVPYLDLKSDGELKNKSLTEIVRDYSKELKDVEAFQVLKSAVESNPEYFEGIRVIDQSAVEKITKSADGVTSIDKSSTTTTEWTDDLIQACTFQDAEGNYYVSYRGTGDRRWSDNGIGLVDESTPMQEAAKLYFEEVAEKYFLDAHSEGKKIFVTGHSKGGNEAQYVYMASKYEHLIDHCYSHDGQGFSDVAVDGFKAKYGDGYEEKLSRMYSICGENDYVHPLGKVIIPKENTYYVKTDGDGFADFHKLERMLGTVDGEYHNIQWTMENGEIVNGQRGSLGEYAAELSERIMQMDEKDRRGAAIAMMSLFDIGNETLGEEPDLEAITDMLADGAPEIIESLFCTEKGRTLLATLIVTAVESLYEAGGAHAVIDGLKIFGTLLIVIVPIVVEVIVLAKIFDFAIEAARKLKELPAEFREYLVKLRDTVLEKIQKAYEKLRELSAGFQYAEANPRMHADTYLLRSYASRLSKANSKIAALDQRLDSLYWSVGLLGLANLVRADLLTSYSARLALASSYLNGVAANLESVETELKNALA